MAGGQNLNGQGQKLERQEGHQYYKNTKYVPKHITVDLAGKTTGKTGAKLSTRQVIDVVNEKGEKVRGYFTENSYIDLSRSVSSALREKDPPAGFEALGVIRQAFLNDPKKLRDFLSAFDDGNKGKTSQILTDIKKPEAQKLYDAQFERIKQTIITHFGLSEELFSGIDKNTPEAYDYIRDLISTTSKTVWTHVTHIGHQKQVEGTLVNRRNNAMSVFGELLDLPNLLAFSSNMTIKDGDSEMHGSFMEQAEGIPLNKFSSKTEGFAGKKLAIAPSAAKQLSNMQILDFLCANVDRHAGNMFYTVDTSDPKTVKITNIQGIDNDASFGFFHGKQVENGRAFDRMSLLNDIKYIDAKTAKAIRELDPDVLEDKLRIAGLSAHEMYAVRDRLRLLRERLQSGRITVVRSDREWERYANDPAFWKNVSYEQTDAASNQKSQNVFKLVQKVCDHYNQYSANYDYPFGKPAGPAEEEIPTVNTLNTEDGAQLRDHIESFERIQKNIDKEKPPADIAPSYPLLIERFKSTLDKMKKADASLTARSGKIGENTAGKSVLDPKKRAELAMELSELRKMAEDCKKDLNARTFNLNIDSIVKDIKAYAQFSHDSISEDAPEAEKNMASKNLSDAVRENRIFIDPNRAELADKRRLTYQTTEHTFASLTDRVEDMAGRSSREYKTMLSELSAKGDLSDDRPAAEQIAGCDALIAAAQAYITHKLPLLENYHTEIKNCREALKNAADENERAQANAELEQAEKNLKEYEDRLTPNEKRRVQFARDLSEYAQVGKSLIVNREKEKGFEKEDADKLDSFVKVCQGLAANYKPEDAASQKAILEHREELAEGIKNIFYTSDRYSAKHPMQRQCAEAFKKIDGCMKMFLAASNAGVEKKNGTAYEALGLDEPDSDVRAAYDKVRDILKKGNADPKLSQRRLIYKKTKHTFDSLMDRRAGIEGRSARDYKNMMSALEQYGDLSKAENASEKFIWCDTLIKAANAYIKHKLPDAGAANKLSENEKNRVRFAKDLKEYAVVHRINLANDQKRIAFQVEDINEMTVFSEKYKDLENAYKNAAPGEEKERAAQNILAEKENFVKGLQNVLDAFDSHSGARNIQLKCMLTLKSIHGFEEAFRDLTNAGKENKVGIYEALGMEENTSRSEICDKVKSIIEKGEKIRAEQQAAENSAQDRVLITPLVTGHSYGGMLGLNHFTKNN